MRNKPLIWYIDILFKPELYNHTPLRVIYILNCYPKVRVQRNHDVIILICNLYYKNSLPMSFFWMVFYRNGSNEIEYMIRGQFLHKFCYELDLNIPDQLHLPAKLSCINWCVVQSCSWCCRRYTIPIILIFESYHKENVCYCQM